MKSLAIPRKMDTVDTFQIKGEHFVVLKKDCLEELLLLMRSFVVGEKMLRGRRTRSFREFLKTTKKR
ncbi:MAG: hypothetical protein AAB524_01505 [Patescibacteria group bacterium]